ncbi:hypothetical protein RP319_06865 [Heyndrickxia coagulans]|uniref:hypothetical protein n=1 Tax=Heyndrickxia coagulans TaxID=1398 RepID=UPI0028FA5610|nr:hypothetical protein [Heyndrickxia coagulans]MDT9755902.1 hypothetical protein [Heyndrickxia coagulans]
MELELVFYNDDFKQQLDNYTITDDQLRFTGHPDEAIALAKDDPERHPVVAVRHRRKQGVGQGACKSFCKRGGGRCHQLF